MYSSLYHLDPLNTQPGLEWVWGKMKVDQAQSSCLGDKIQKQKNSI